MQIPRDYNNNPLMKGALGIASYIIDMFRIRCSRYTCVCVRVDDVVALLTSSVFYIVRVSQ